ncbi:MAG: 4a-hydroxytetrahydrobiopterin dehydratase [Rhodospirillaceae bacterium]|nr:4a-hydroxytetrahydrobiopterin dehydratase [Rhodospirillaceae bacterium]OUX67865.1 MAG: 4a-hydroxytetrahydrobiopterin dehydratase [bacterium TMED178]
MSDLSKKKCIPCQGNIPAFDEAKIRSYLRKVDGWKALKDGRHHDYIEKKFRFKNFVESEKFVGKIGKIAEREGHHPEISFGWGYVIVRISTHAIKGLADSDFILAAKIDQIQ